MNTSNAQQIEQAVPNWRAVCSRRDLVAHSGVVAKVDDEQVALFYFPNASEGGQVYAVANRDPRSGANVIGRGIVGSIYGDLVIASPLYKQHYRLADGGCLEQPDQYLRTWPARLNGDAVEVG